MLRRLVSQAVPRSIAEHEKERANRDKEGLQPESRVGAIGDFAGSGGVDERAVVNKEELQCYALLEPLRAVT